ncbi:MAG: NAD-dependent epimerase/dehydratase family protein [Sporolactobacillus sp.]
MRKVVVTGGAGFIGSHVVTELLREGFEVTVIDNFSTGSRQMIAHLPIALYVCNVSDPAVTRIIQSLHPDYIVHLAAQISVARSVEDPLTDEETNIHGSLNILKAAQLSGVKKLVFASSAAVYGSPVAEIIDTSHPTVPESPYGLAKLTVEHYLHMFERYYHLPYAILRFSNVYGPGQDAHGEGGVVSIFSDRIARGLTSVIYGDGEQTRDFIYVDDVARAIIASLSVRESMCLNVSSGTSITINQLFRQMKKVAHSQCQAVYRPARAGDIRRSKLANAQTKKLLEWKPIVPLERGLLETLRALQMQTVDESEDRRAVR